MISEDMDKILKTTIIKKHKCVLCGVTSYLFIAHDCKEIDKAVLICECGLKPSTKDCMVWN